MLMTAKIADPTTTGQAGTKRKSRVPGVMITQFARVIPEGKSTPDFQRKPISVTIQEGKLAVFRAVVVGDPAPKVTWKRAKGDVSDASKFKSNYDKTSGEHSLQINKVSGVDSDTYKCFAVNEYGKAVCTATLNVIVVGFKKQKAMEELDHTTTTDPTDFRKMLKKSKQVKTQTTDEHLEERFWEVIMAAERKDYERICAEFGVKDLRLILKKIAEKKQEREEEHSKYVESVRNLRHVQLRGDGSASFELELQLKDPASRIFLYKDGVMTPYSHEISAKHSLKTLGKKHVFSINDLVPEDAGMYEVDVEEVNIFSTELRMPNVDFVVKIQEVTAQEREDALFECVLTFPLPRIKWMGKNTPLENGEKYSITVSEDKLIHSLLIKDCKQLDKGIYAAVAGIHSCSAWLVVQAATDAAPGLRKTTRKTTHAGGAGVDLSKVAEEQRVKIQEERDKMEAAVRSKKEAELLISEEPSSTGGAKLTVVKGLCKDSDGGDTPKAVTASSKAKKTGSKDGGEINDSARGGSNTSNASESAGSACVSTELRPANVSRDEKPNETVRVVPTEPKGESTAPCVPSGTKDSPLAKPSDSLKRHNITTGLNEDSSVGGQFGGIEGSSGSDSHSRDVINSKQMHDDALDPNGLSGSDGNDVSHASSKTSSPARPNQGSMSDKDPHSEYGETEEPADSTVQSKRKRPGPLLQDVVIDPGVQFVSGLSDVDAIVGGTVEIMCKLSSEDCEGAWFKDGKKLSESSDLQITKEGATHKLIISHCKGEHSGTYRFEAGGRKTEAEINVKDPPRFDQDDLSAFTKPVTVRTGQSAVFKLPFEGNEPMRIQWFREGEELLENSNTKIEKYLNQSGLLLSRCQRRDAGEIRIKLKNDHGATEAISQLIVLDKPTLPQGPAEVTESSPTCIEFKWRPPKDDGGSPVINYMLERRQVGRNTWKKIGEVPPVPSFRDTDVDPGRKYCYRIRAVNAEGISEVMETDDVQAGTLAFPGPPTPPKVMSASRDCITLSWAQPTHTGGSCILGYTLEKRKKGSNIWSVVNELIKEKTYAVKDIVECMEYEFRVLAINISGAGEFSNPSESVFARDPKKPPGKVMELKVSETSYTHLSLSWTKPEEKPGDQDEAKGYHVEIRQAESAEWSRCNVTPFILTSYCVKGLRSMDMYWVRVIATNEGGESPPAELDNYVLAMPSPVRPRFTDQKMKSFMVVKAGNSVRITVNYEASPRPQVYWLKDNVPVTKRVTISNCDGSSQLLIPTSERSDSGVYSIVVKNLVGQETFVVEVRVTDDPKPPGPVALEENVPGTVTITWEPSADEKRDDRLHYTVCKLDSTKRTWSTVADSLFNNKFTVCNIMHGREYHFWVYAKNDMGMSAPSVSPTWGMEKKKEKFVVKTPSLKDPDLRCAPSFLVTLKRHTAPKGYECYMSCAVKGNPKPRVTWYRDSISLNTNTNYHISNTCGVCSMLILCVGPKDTGEYTIVAENALGRAECSTVLCVRE